MPKIYKEMKYLLTLISTLLLLTACNKDDETDFVNQTSTRAVLIYMAGENNLTSNQGIRYLRNDLDEIIEGSKSLTNMQRLFVFVDSLATNKDEKGYPYLIEVHGGKIYDRIRFENDFYACDEDRFREIVNWMPQNVKANGYGLVLWGHASGWAVDLDTIPSSQRAYGLDTNYDQGPYAEKWMNITQMAKALKGLPKFDFIFCDCCNMISAEVGYELRDAADYIIGSPAEIPGNGAPYDIIIPQLYKNGSSLYKGIIDTYFNFYIDDYPTSDPALTNYSVPLAVIDTQYMEQLATLTRNIVSDFATEFPAQLELTKIPFYFGFDRPSMYDMQGVMKRFATPSAFDAWRVVFQSAVPYSRISKRWMTIYNTQHIGFPYFEQDDEYWGCASMFVPQGYVDYRSGYYAYNARANNFGWNRIIDWSRFGW